MFVCRYNNFEVLFSDWQYLLRQRQEGMFDISKLQADDIIAKLRPMFVFKPEEKDNTVIQRDGKLCLLLSTEADKAVVINHTSFQE